MAVLDVLRNRRRTPLLLGVVVLRSEVIRLKLAQDRLLHLMLTAILLLKGRKSCGRRWSVLLLEMRRLVMQVQVLWGLLNLWLSLVQLLLHRTGGLILLSPMSCLRAPVLPFLKRGLLLIQRCLCRSCAAGIPSYYPIPRTGHLKLPIG